MWRWPRIFSSIEKTIRLYIKETGVLKGQSAVEFLTTYAWAFLVLGIFVVSVLAVVSLPSTSTPLYLSQSCYISPSFPCSQALVLTNSTATKFIAIFQNNLGARIYFQSNAITLTPSYYSNTTYTGNCFPQNSISGALIICNVSMPGYQVPTGAQLSPRFTMSYQICTPTCTMQVYNTSGTTIAVVQPYKAVIYEVQLLTSPTNGLIALNGVRYPNGANVIFIRGTNYLVYAIPPPSKTFTSWTASANVILGGSSQSTTANALGPGTLTATFG